MHVNAITPNSNNQATNAPTDIEQALTPEGIGTPVREADALQPVAAPKRQRAAKAADKEKKNARTKKKAIGGNGKAAAQKAEKPVKEPKAPREKVKRPAELLAELAPEEKEELEAIRSEYASIGRKDAEQTFAIGDLIRRAEAIVPSGTLGAWVEADLGISARQGRNYSAVATNLGPWRPRLTAQGVHPSTLYAMASAAPEKIEVVVKAYESGARPKHKDIVVALAGPKPEKVEVGLVDVGGPAGLKAIAAAKTSTGIRQFIDGIGAITEAVEVVLGAAGTKRVDKATLAKAVELLARRCSGELRNLALFVHPIGPGVAGDTVALKFPAGSGWHTVAAVLEKLSVAKQWGLSAEFRPWLSGLALPALKWSLGKEGGAVPERQASADPSVLADEPVSADEPEDVDEELREAGGSDESVDEVAVSTMGLDDAEVEEADEEAELLAVPEALPVAAIARRFERPGFLEKKLRASLEAPNGAPGVS